MEGTESSALRFEAEGKRKDGSIFPIEVSAARTKIGDRNLVTVALRDITERKRAEAQITAALAEKEALLKEIHHRVKNNLQVVVSLLHLQSEHVKDRTAHGVFLDSENRVKSMALMHENLYRSKDLSSIHVSDYIQTLARDLTRSYSLTSSGVELAVHVEDLVLGMDSAIHCGLLVNELVSNALKHAFPGNRPGSVTVDLREVEDGRYSLIVRDDGVGLPRTFDSRRSDTLGLQLVHTLAEHLDGTVAIRSGPGTEFEIRFRDVDAGN
jgi:two-component sensor histidine kinase